MKKRIVSILLTMCMLLSVVPIMSFTASAAVGDTFTYQYKSQTLTYTVLTEDVSGGTVSVNGNSNSGNIEIPSSVTNPNNGKNYSVTTIAYGAFNGCTGLTSVIIPDSVTTIEDTAFYGCSGLTTVNIGNSVNTIGYAAFQNCENLKSVNIPDSVSEIQKRAFYNCAKLENVEIGANVYYIGTGAFNKISFEKVKFKGELPGMHKDSFSSINITEVTAEENYDSNVSVEIVGFKNGKTYKEEPFWTGELLKPVVTGYDGSKGSLYYRFTTNVTKVTRKLNFFTSNTNGVSAQYYHTNKSLYSGMYDGLEGFYFRDEAFASIFYGTGYGGDRDIAKQPQWIECTVYTISKDGNGKFTATAIAKKRCDLTDGRYITAPNEAINKEFENSKVIVMQQGESTTVNEAFALTGFTHVTCSCCYFENIKTEQYNGQPLTVNEITNGKKDTKIIAGTGRTGLSKLTFDFYSDDCDYHDSAYSSSNMLHVEAYIYVMSPSEFTATTHSITVNDKTGEDATSTYTIASRKPDLTTFTGLNASTKYNVSQKLSVTVTEEEKDVTYSGLYNNYVSTLPDVAHEITNLTPDNTDAINTNKGYITIDKTTAKADETVTVTVVPNDGYILKSLIYKDKGADDSTGTEIKATDNVYSFTMPYKDIEVKAVFKVAHTHNFTYEAKDDSITATCSADGCDLTDKKVTIKLVSPAEEYNAAAKECTFEGISTWTTAGLATPTIKYATKKADNTYDTPTETKPVDVNDYKAIATLTVGDTTYSAEKEFKITPKALTVTGTTVSDKKYDGNNTATVTANGTLSGVCEADKDNVSIKTATATFDDAGVKEGKTITVVYTLDGTKAGNYTVSNTTINDKKIEKAVLTVTGTTVENKTYDGTTAAKATVGTVTGKVGTEDVKVEIDTAAFADKDAGTSKTVNIKYKLTGTDAAKYALASDTATATADISKAEITSIVSETADKTYNGNNTATVTVNSFAGKVGTEAVSVTATGTFADKNVGKDKSVTITYALSGDADVIKNYVITEANKTASDTAEITAKELTVNGTTVSDKNYDGSNTATVSAKGDLVGVEAVDSGKVTIKTATATFDDASVKDAKTVTVVYTLDGTEAANYTVKNGELKANIAKADYTVADIEVQTVTSRAVYLKPITVDIEDAEVSYRIDDDEWQDSPEFTDLTPDTKYDFYVKVSETENYNEYVSEAFEVTTLKEYNITWVDEDGETVLDSAIVAEGTMPEYKGETPDKADTDEYVYEFKGWDKEIVEATEDATYKAVYEETYSPIREVVLVLKNVTAEEETVTFVRNGGKFMATFTPTEGKTLPKEISIVVGNTTLSQEDYTYDSTTGELVINEGVIEENATITIIAKTDYGIDIDSDSDSDSDSDMDSVDEDFLTKLINFFMTLIEKIKEMFA